MPERNLEFGQYGARGIKGHEAVGRRLDALAGFVATPVTAHRGLLARLHYLTRTDHARQAAREAGLTVTDRTLRAWLDGRRTPSPSTVVAIVPPVVTTTKRPMRRILPHGRFGMMGV